jgi:hypothetical protein
MPDINKHCYTCRRTTTHIVSGSGHKSTCPECGTSEEYGYEEGVEEPDRL